MNPTGSTGLSISTNLSAGCKRGKMVLLKYSSSGSSYNSSKSDFFTTSTYGYSSAIPFSILSISSYLFFSHTSMAFTKYSRSFKTSMMSTLNKYLLIAFLIGIVLPSIKSLTSTIHFSSSVILSSKNIC